MRIRLKSDDGIAANSTLELEDGTPLHYVEKLHIYAKGTDLFRAEVTFLRPQLEFNSLKVTVSEEHLRELADAHGFDLVKRG